MDRVAVVAVEALAYVFWWDMHKAGFYMNFRQWCMLQNHMKKLDPKRKTTLSWQLLTGLLKITEVLATAGNCWQLLATAGNCWQLLATAGNCWQLLAVN